MWYAYVLQSMKDKRLYVGMTSDLRRRFKEHNTKSGGNYTNKNGPFKLIFYEAYLEKKDAATAEKFFKSGYGREVLKKRQIKELFWLKSFGNMRLIGASAEEADCGVV